MTEKLMVSVVGVFPLVDPNNAQKIEAEGYTEVDASSWITAQVAAGTLALKEPEDPKAPKPQAKK